VQRQGVPVAVHQAGPGQPAGGEGDVLERQARGLRDLLDRPGAEGQRRDDPQPRRVGEQPDDRPGLHAVDGNCAGPRVVAGPAG
jgi:hypothetical protein